VLSETTVESPRQGAQALPRAPGVGLPELRDERPGVKGAPVAHEAHLARGLPCCTPQRRATGQGERPSRPFGSSSRVVDEGFLRGRQVASSSPGEKGKGEWTSGPIRRLQGEGGATEHLSAGVEPMFQLMSGVNDDGFGRKRRPSRKGGFTPPGHISGSGATHHLPKTGPPAKHPRNAPPGVPPRESAQVVGHLCGGRAPGLQRSRHPLPAGDSSVTN